MLDQSTILFGGNTYGVTAICTTTTAAFRCARLARLREDQRRQHLALSAGHAARQFAADDASAVGRADSDRSGNSNGLLAEV